MKHILITTIAAVLLVGCGPSAPDISIYQAAETGNIEAVKQHLAAGTDVNAKTEEGFTPLHWATREGHKAVAELLIAEGADVNTKDGWEWTPLHNAAWWGHKEIVELLLANGAGVNAKNNKGWTPLHMAAINGHNEIVGLLVAGGADVNSKNNNGETPTDLAAGRVADLFPAGRVADFFLKLEILSLKEDVAQLGVKLAAIELGSDQTAIKKTVTDLTGTVLGQKDKLAKLENLILDGENAADPPLIEKLQGVFVIRGKAGLKYEVQYHTGDNDWQVRETVTLQANRQLYIDSSSYDEKRFYRIKQTD